MNYIESVSPFRNDLVRINVQVQLFFRELKFVISGLRHFGKGYIAVLLEVQAR